MAQNNYKGKIFERSSGSFRYLGGVVAVGQCQRSDLQTVGAIAFGEALAGESVSYGRVHSGGRRRVSKEQEIREA